MTLYVDVTVEVEADEVLDDLDDDDLIDELTSRGYSVTKDEYVDSAIQEDVKNTPTRSLYELNEIGKLVSDQFDDMTTFNIKQEVINVG